MRKNAKKYRRKERKMIVMCAVLIIILVGTFIAFVVKLANENVDKDSEADNIMQESYASVEEQIQNEEAFETVTDYCNLYYPKKWEEQITVEIVEGEVYTVKFYGKVEGKEIQPLFDIEFGDGHGDAIGTLKRDGNQITVKYLFAEPKINALWSDEDADIIYAMQEDINYLIGMLETEKGFTAIY